MGVSRPNVLSAPQRPLLARAQLVRGDPEEARETLLDALRIGVELGYPEILAYRVAFAAELAAPFSPESAAELAGAGEAAFERLGIPMQRIQRLAHGFPQLDGYRWAAVDGWVGRVRRRTDDSCAAWRAHAPPNGAVASEAEPTVNPPGGRRRRGRLERR